MAQPVSSVHRDLVRSSSRRFAHSDTFEGHGVNTRYKKILATNPTGRAMIWPLVSGSQIYRWRDVHQGRGQLSRSLHQAAA